MNLAAKLKGKPLAYPILTKSIVLAVIFILFNVAETLIKGWWKGKTLSESLPKFGGGSPAEIMVVAAILAVALVPFFAFRELSLALGRGVLGGLLMRGSREIAANRLTRLESGWRIVLGLDGCAFHPRSFAPAQIDR